MQTYLFYDIETTGLSKPFDQVLQFAAIRTDLNLKEIERYELKVKLNPDIIPAPRALITHHIGIKQTLDGISEFDAIKKIHRWLNEPGTISLGYNTLGFDDEFLRFSFYRNLLPPYTHQYANQCGRMDLYPMAAMYFLFKNQTLSWPTRNDKISLKLEALNEANHLASGRAHDAMVDVEATLALARCFFKERDMWDYLLGYFNKQIDQERLQGLANTEALMIDGVFGIDQCFQCPVLFLGNHRHYKNQTLWLKLDSETLTHFTPETIKESTWVMNKKLAEPSFVLPFKERFLSHLTPERRQLSAANIKWLQQNPAIFEQIQNYHAEYKYPALPNTDIEASLYLNGFWSGEEDAFCRRFHTAQPQDKASMTEQLKSPKLKMLALRILGRHFPEVMTPAQKESYAEYLQQVNGQGLLDFRGKSRLTAEVAMKEIDELSKQEGLTSEQMGLLKELASYLKEQFSDQPL